METIREDLNNTYLSLLRVQSLKFEAELYLLSANALKEREGEESREISHVLYIGKIYTESCKELLGLLYLLYKTLYNAYENRSVLLDELKTITESFQEFGRYTDKVEPIKVNDAQMAFLMKRVTKCHEYVKLKPLPVVEETENQRGRWNYRYNLRRDRFVHYIDEIVSTPPTPATPQSTESPSTSMTVCDDEVLFDEPIEEEEDIRAKAKGIIECDIKGLKLSTFVDYETTKRDVIVWTKKKSNDNKQNQADRKYFAEMNNGANTSKRNHSHLEEPPREPLQEDELSDPLTLAATIVRECPLCLEQCAGLSVLYARICQHAICRNCMVKCSTLAAKQKSALYCPICRTTITSVFSFARGQNKRAKMVFYDSVPVRKA